MGMDVGARMRIRYVPRIIRNTHTHLIAPRSNSNSMRSTSGVSSNEMSVSHEIDRQLEEGSKRYNLMQDPRLRRVGQEHDREADEEHPPGGLLPARAARLPAHDPQERRRQRACALDGLLAEGHKHLPDAILAAKPEEVLGPETADAIKVLWRDSVAARVLDEHASKFY
ncbi:hypothetical protein B0H17DRAFT_436320 [Mycena rosella]|uniref:Uncharacterized protein n=1 Tax=Mycena rosella TaxID=1033263 RepID=A0AAD7CFH5_MYCRO|nr:hypothetical protein B0H17DRAFT_436320 [Mycena rosella]